MSKRLQKDIQDPSISEQSQFQGQNQSKSESRSHDHVLIYDQDLVDHVNQQQNQQQVEQDILRLEEDSQKLREMINMMLENLNTTSAWGADQVQKLITQKCLQPGTSQGTESLQVLAQNFQAINQEIKQVIECSVMNQKGTSEAKEIKKMEDASLEVMGQKIQSSSPSDISPRNPPGASIPEDSSIDLHKSSATKVKKEVFNEVAIIKKFKGPLVKRQGNLSWTSALCSSFAIFSCLLGMVFPAWVIFTSHNKTLNPPISEAPGGLQLHGYGLWAAVYHMSSTKDTFYAFVDSTCSTHICFYTPQGTKRCFYHSVSPLAFNCAAYIVVRLFYCLLFCSLVLSTSLLMVAVCRCHKGTGRLLLKYGGFTSFAGSLLCIIVIAVFTACLFVENGANQIGALAISFTNLFVAWFMALAASATSFMAYFMDYRDKKKYFYGAPPPERHVDDFKLEDVV